MSDSPSHKKPIHSKQHILSDLGLLYAAAIWGSTFYIVKDALSGVDPVIMVGFRFMIAGGAMLIFLLATGRKFFVGIGRAFFLASILTALYLTQTIGLKYTSATNSAFITGLFIFFTPMLLHWVFKKKPKPLEWIGSLVSLCGLWVLTGGLKEINFGDALTMIAALTYALHVLYSDKYMKSGIDPYIISCQQFLLVGAMSLFIGWVFDLPFEVTTSKAGWVILFLALGPTLSAFVIQMLAQRITTPIKVTLIFALEPVFAALFAWTLGGESVRVESVFGGLLIVFALAISGMRMPQMFTKYLPGTKSQE